MSADEYHSSHPGEEAREVNGVELEPVSFPIDTHYAVDSTDDLRSLVPPSGSRIAALTDQLHRSQANLESTAAQFTELASAIPGDLSDRLSGILTKAMAEADDIRAEARRFAQEIQGSAEKQATEILDQARAERRAVAELRAEVEAHRRQIQVHASRLREQAILSAVEMMKEAESQAAEILTRMNSNINMHVAEAQTRLNELMQARSKIMDRITDSASRQNQTR